MRGRLMMLVMFLSACSDDPVHKGKVTDRWGKPIAGVSIGFSGSAKQLISGADGGFSIPVHGSEIKIRAGKPGYIKKSMKLAAHEGDENPNPVLFALYPDPEHSGFYAVGNMSYSELTSTQIKTNSTTACRSSTWMGTKSFRL